MNYTIGDAIPRHGRFQKMYQLLFDVKLRACFAVAKVIKEQGLYRILQAALLLFWINQIAVSLAEFAADPEAAKS